MDFPTHQGFHLVGHEIFKLLAYNDIFKCRKVCRQFKSVVDDPYFCLKLLKSIGHPEECHRKWINLIQKCKEVGISNDTFVIILLQKFGNSVLVEKFSCTVWVSKSELRNGAPLSRF